MRTIAVCLALAAAAFAQPVLNPSKLLDLTYSFDARTIYWPNAKPFIWEKETWGARAGGQWYASARYAASEHGGTHLDSPVHFAKGAATVEQIPVGKLVAPAFVIDISRASATNPDYQLAPSDIAAWEKQHGPIPAGALALVRTGWGRFWPDKKKYLGSDTPGDTEHLHFPGISPEAAKALLGRKVIGVGIDTASIDYGASKEFPTHRVLYSGGIYGLENIAHLDRLPATGAWVIALPMKIGGGSGAPVRIVALLP